MAPIEAPAPMAPVLVPMGQGADAVVQVECEEGQMAHNQTPLSLWREH